MLLTRRLLLQVAGASAVVLASGARAQVRAASVPLRFGRARLLVDASIEGRSPVPIMIDTGAHLSVIERDFARQLGLSSVGRTPASIAGRRAIYNLRQANRVMLAGGVDVGRVAFAEIEGELGDGASASISGGIVTIMDSQFDFRGDRLLIFPEGGPPRAGWTRHQRGVVNDGSGTRYIFAEAKAGAVPVRLALDTGAPTPLALEESVLRRAAPDWQSLNWTPFAKDGSTVRRQFRLSVPFAIGGLVLERQLVRVWEESRLFQQGLVGLPLIRQLDVATSVKEATLFTRPNGLPAPPQRYNMSGLWVDRRGDRLVAGAVGRGSPAEAAGIKVGDALEGLPFRAMIAALNRPSGSNVRLSVAQRPVELVLRDYL